jgi:hypothetical protein
MLKLLYSMQSNMNAHQSADNLDLLISVEPVRKQR